MSDFQINGRYRDILRRLFKQGDRGGLRFGWTGIAARCDSLESLEGQWWLFRDYILEGFLSYLVSCRRNDDGLRLSIMTTGTNRDDYIDPQVRHYINAAGLDFQEQIGASSKLIDRLCHELQPIYESEMSQHNIVARVDEPAGTNCPFSISFAYPLNFSGANDLLENVEPWESSDPHYPAERGFVCGKHRHAISGPLQN